MIKQAKSIYLENYAKYRLLIYIISSYSADKNVFKWKSGEFEDLANFYSGARVLLNFKESD